MAAYGPGSPVWETLGNSVTLICRSLLVRPVVLTRVHRLKDVGQNPLVNRGDATGGPATVRIGLWTSCGRRALQVGTERGRGGIELWTALCTARPGNRLGSLQGAPFPSTPCGPEKHRPLSTMWTCGADIRTAAGARWPTRPDRPSGRGPGDPPARRPRLRRAGRRAAVPARRLGHRRAPGHPAAGRARGRRRAAGDVRLGLRLPRLRHHCGGRPPGRRRRPASRDRPGDRRRLAGPGHRRAARRGTGRRSPTR